MGFQVGLPLEDRPLKGKVLLGPTGRSVVKLFLFVHKSAYDCVTFDEEVGEQGEGDSETGGGEGGEG